MVGQNCSVFVKPDSRIGCRGIWAKGNRIQSALCIRRLHICGFNQLLIKMSSTYSIFSPWLGIRRCRGPLYALFQAIFYKGFKPPQVLVSAGVPGTDPLQIPRDHQNALGNQLTIDTLSADFSLEVVLPHLVGHSGFKGPSVISD